MTPAYDQCLLALAQALDQRCQEALNLVVIDGLPASGKSTLTLHLAQHLRSQGRCVASMENDWFIDRQIRNPLAILRGLALALSPLAQGQIEQRLLARFLDQPRLRHFQDQLRQARLTLEQGQPAVLTPQQAFWNLRYPPDLHGAAPELTLEPGAVLLIEGTLTRAVWHPQDPNLTAVLVQVPASVARARFLDRNQHRDTMRNRAFSALALHDTTFHLANRMLLRHQASYPFVLQLGDLARPILLQEGAMR